MLATATRTGPRSAATSLAKRCLVLARREACALAGRLGRARKGGEVEELYRTAGWSLGSDERHAAGSARGWASLGPLSRCSSVRSLPPTCTPAAPLRAAAARARQTPALLVGPTLRLDFHALASWRLKPVAARSA